MPAWLAAAMLGCASPPPASPPHDLIPLWREFTRLPDERAMAIAGDPTRGPWVAGVSAGHPSAAEAAAAALAECRVQRQEGRMQSECVLYAVGPRIVWRGR
jgi:hypothetical protein